MLSLTWKGYYKYTIENVEQYAPDKPGVYKIAILQKGGRLKVRYVGQTDNLKRRLKEHLDFDREENECLRERLKKYSASFAFAAVARQGDRDGAERALYLHYEPVCNDEDSIPS
jgi:excinuclease UvrABC nuclease subunit